MATYEKVRQSPKWNQPMNISNTLVCITAGTLGLSALVFPSQVRSESCEASIRGAKERIERGRNITVMSDTVDGSQTYPNHPNGRPRIVTFRFQGKAADSVMESPAFQKAIASESIKSCGSVGAVTFGRNQTDWSITLGLMSNGSIEKFE